MTISTENDFAKVKEGIGRPILVNESDQHSSIKPSSTQGVSVTSFSGPIPPPECLEKYEKILPGSANRLLELAEGEARHRRELQVLEANHRIRFESKQIELAQKNQVDNTCLAIRGQKFALFLGSLGLCGGIFCAYINQPFPATFLACGGLAGLISPFLKKNSEAR